MTPPDVTFTPSANIAQLKESATIAASQRAKALRAAGRPILDLGAGEPDFDTPEMIRRAAQSAIDNGATRYTATEGILPLRTAIAETATARRKQHAHGDTISPAEVVVSNGSKQSLFNACFSLFGPDDEVLIPTPSWTATTKWSRSREPRRSQCTVIPREGSKSRLLIWRHTPLYGHAA